MYRYTSCNRWLDVSMQQMISIVLILCLTKSYWSTHAWISTPSVAVAPRSLYSSINVRGIAQSQSCLQQATNVDMESSKETSPKEDIPYDYEVPEDAIIHIKPAAMRRLRELRDQRRKDEQEEFLILRMGVRSGGCSGMSYVMDFCTADSINAEDDQIDTYESDRIQCVVDSKSMLYLYGLQLDYSTELIGGGFKFYNPNAEESCGCGSSFGV